MTYITQYQKDPSVTAFGNLRLYLQRHAYKKGAYAGAAPADSTRRGKSHFRVEMRTDNLIAIVFHWTDIVRCHADGTIVLDSGGYHEAPTTRAALEHALWLCGYKGWLKSTNHNGYKNTTLHMPPAKGGAWIKVGWADGITITPDGTITGYGPIKAYRADTEARRQWRADAQEFKAVLPVLLAGLESSRIIRGYLPGRLLEHDAALNPEHWPHLAEYLAFHAGFDAPTAWAYLYRKATNNMRVVEIVEPGWTASDV